MHTVVSARHSTCLQTGGCASRQHCVSNKTAPLQTICCLARCPGVTQHTSRYSVSCKGSIRTIKYGKSRQSPVFVRPRRARSGLVVVHDNKPRRWKATPGHASLQCGSPVCPRLRCQKIHAEHLQTWQPLYCVRAVLEGDGYCMEDRRRQACCTPKRVCFKCGLQLSAALRLAGVQIRLFMISAHDEPPQRWQPAQVRHHGSGSCRRSSRLRAAAWPAGCSASGSCSDDAVRSAM